MYFYQCDRCNSEMKTKEEIAEKISLEVTEYKRFTTVFLHFCKICSENFNEFLQEKKNK